MFDDYPNLDSLAALKENWTWAGACEFVANGRSSVIGRPVALLTFVPQASDWLVDASGFKLFNLCVHTINSFFVYLVTKKLLFLHQYRSGHVQSGSAYHAVIALAVAMVWLLHPANISTYAYVIQRMTLLSAFFSLLAINCYIQPFVLMEHNPDRVINYPVRALSILFLVFLGLLCKENGLLAIAGILAIRYSFLRDTKVKVFDFLLIYLPLIAGVIGLVVLWDKLVVAGYQYRDFSLYERLLSQARILLQYLHLFYLPLPSDLVFFKDSFSKSVSLMQPLTTLFAVIAWALVILFSLFCRTRLPWLFFSVVWFLGFHVLESTILPLELYFEHRNYMPFAGLSIALVVFLVSACRWLFIRKYHLALLVSVFSITFWLVGLVYLSHQHASLWGSPLRLGEFLYKVNPGSERTLDYYGKTLLQYGRYKEASRIFDEMLSLSDGPTAVINQLYLSCYLGDEVLPEDEVFVERIRGSSSTGKITGALFFVLQAMPEKKCIYPPVTRMRRLIDAILKLEGYQTPDMYRISAIVYAFQGRFNEALNALDESITRVNHNDIKRFDYQLDKLEMLCLSGRRDASQALLSKLKMKRNDMLESQSYRLDQLEGQLGAR